MQVAAVVQHGTAFVIGIKAKIPLHALGGENFLEKLFAMFHIICIFAMQSRAFLSQLSVTGDESGFFYVFFAKV